MEKSTNLIIKKERKILASTTRGFMRGDDATKKSRRNRLVKMKNQYFYYLLPCYHVNMLP